MRREAREVPRSRARRGSVRVLEVDGALATSRRAPQRQLHAAVRLHAELLFGECRPRHITTEALQAFAIILVHRDRRMDVEPAVLDPRANNSRAGEHRRFREPSKEPFVGGRYVPVLGVRADEAGLLQIARELDADFLGDRRQRRRRRYRRGDESKIVPVVVGHEHTIDHEDMKMWRDAQRLGEALNGHHSAALRVGLAGISSPLLHRPKDRPHEDLAELREDFRLARQQAPQLERRADDVLPNRNIEGKDSVHEMLRGARHPPRTTAGTDRPAFT